jgi:hypothetical protein
MKCTVKSNCTKVHPGRDPGPCSAPKCGKFDPSNRYVHFCQKALDQPEFTDYVKKHLLSSLSVHALFASDASSGSPALNFKNERLNVRSHLLQIQSVSVIS